MGVFFFFFFLGGGVLKFQIFLGFFEIPVFFVFFFFIWRGVGVNARCWARAYE